MKQVESKGFGRTYKAKRVGKKLCAKTSVLTLSRNVISIGISPSANAVGIA